MTDLIDPIDAAEPQPSLLHLDCSATAPESSVSRQLAALFARTWREIHPTGRYRHRDLAAEPVPLVTGAYCALGRRLERDGLVAPARVAEHVANADEAEQWALTLPLITELTAADTLLIGTPMYNYSVPAALKAWIDRVSFPGAFRDPDTGTRVLCGTRVVIVTARGGAYGPGMPREGFDFLEPYLRKYFGNLGVSDSDITVVNAELTLATLVPRLRGFAPMAADSLAAARATLVELAGRTGTPVLSGGAG